MQADCSYTQMYVRVQMHAYMYTRMQMHRSISPHARHLQKEIDIVDRPLFVHICIEMYTVLCVHVYTYVMYMCMHVHVLYICIDACWHIVHI